MGHHISWDNEDRTVVLQEYTAEASKDDLYALVQESAAMLNSVTHTVHLIVDEHNINLRLNPSDIAYIEQWVPTNQGMVVVIVSPSNLAMKSALLQLGTQLRARSFSQSYFAGNREEARMFLQEHFHVRYAAPAPK